MATLLMLQENACEKEISQECCSLPEISSKQVTMVDILDAIEKLSTKVDNMEVCNNEMIKLYIRELKKADNNTPNSKPENSKVHSSCGYSPDVKDNRNTVNRVTCFAKETQGQEKSIHKGMGILKNLGTINISDIEDTEDESYKYKKRTVTRGEFIRPAPDNKRQNIDKGKLPFGESYQTLGDGEHCDDIKPFNSDYRRGATAKDTIITSATMSRRLTFTPSPGEGSKDKLGIGARSKTGPSPRATKVTRNSPIARVKGGVGIGKSNAFRNNNGLMVPKHFRCAFKTSSDMKLDHVEIRICAYVFQEDFNSGDTIFKVGRNEYSRADFECMCSGLVVSREIILMMALKVSWTQHNNICKSLWCLPPSFAVDVARGSTPEALHAFYGNDWTVRFDRLRLIYVPIEDTNGHWYLMVVSTDTQKIYHLDSHFKEEALEERRFTIRNIAAALSKLVDKVYEGNISFCTMTDFHYWDIDNATGIPNYGNSDNSALCVVEWLNMQNNFTHNLVGVMNESVTRITVAMRLLMGNHNECNNDLIRKAREYWQLMTNGVD